MKKIVFIAIVFFIAIFIIVIVKWYSSPMFEVESTLLKNINVSNTDFAIEICRVKGGATTKDVLQLKKVYLDGHRKIIKNLDNYNQIINYFLVGDSLTIILNDTGYFVNRPDTFVINIK